MHSGWGIGLGMRLHTIVYREHQNNIFTAIEGFVTGMALWPTYRGWMSLEDGVHFPQREEVLLAQQTSLAPGGIQDGAGMALGG